MTSPSDNINGGVSYACGTPSKLLSISAAYSNSGDFEIGNSCALRGLADSSTMEPLKADLKFTRGNASTMAVQRQLFW